MKYVRKTVANFIPFKAKANDISKILDILNTASREDASSVLEFVMTSSLYCSYEMKLISAKGFFV